MKKKILLFFFLLGLSLNSFGIETIELNENSKKEAVKLLENIRKRIQKEEKEKAKALAEERKRAEAEEKARLEEEARQKKLAEEQAKLDVLAQEESVKEETEGDPEKGEIRYMEVPEMDDKNQGEVAVGMEEAGDKASSTKKDALKEYLKEKDRLAKEEKAKIKTPMQKLELTQKLANEKVDFYERVVRSVAREEKEVKEIKEILNSDI
ncbi:MAG: hypothetical protein IJG31_04210 [Fusobacterium sp.]|nr:hypothetical protein [Fusobacterium sp.]